MAMNGGQQNSLNQQWSLTPGRVIRKIKRHTMPSGKVVELQWVSTTIRDNQGVWHSEETIEMVPPSEDGSVVTETNYENLNECTRCLSVTVEPYRCPECCKTYCLPCTEKIMIEEMEVRVCVDCAKEARTPVFLKILKNMIWG
jgi:hypothetical protein